MDINDCLLVNYTYVITFNGKMKTQSHTKPASFIDSNYKPMYQGFIQC